MHDQAPPQARWCRSWLTVRPTSGRERFRDDAQLGRDVLPVVATIQTSRRARSGAPIAPSRRNRVSLASLAPHWPERRLHAPVLPACLPSSGLISVLRHGHLESGHAELLYHEVCPP